LAIDNARTFVRERAVKHGITLDVDVDKRLGEYLGDERKIKQILLNLLSNAVKFTPEGGEVRVTSARRNGGLSLSINDTGIGIAAEDIPKVLAPFGQVESKVRRKHEGTGLGLPLAKQLVELHGGLLTIDSRLDVGTTVTILLPASRMVAPRPRATVASAVA